MNFRNTVVVGSLVALVSGCAYLPEGYSSRNSNYESPGRFFVKDEDSDRIPVAEPKVATIPEGPGLKIRKSARGNMESYVVRGQRYYTLDSAEGYSAKGVASWYGPNFHGRTASNGEVYDMYRLTAAHKTLPLPTYARVTHVGNGRSVVVKINDRGPFSGDRIIDLSFAAALRLGMINDGTGEVEVQALSPEEMMVLSGPDNNLDIDFYNDEQEAVAEAAEAAPAKEEEQISVAAVDVDQNPITAQPISPSVVNQAVASQSLEDGVVVQPAGQPVQIQRSNNVRINPSVPVAATEESLLIDVAVAESATAETIVLSDELVSDAESADQLVETQALARTDAPEALDGDLQDALLPVVADANVQGLSSVSAAVQTVPEFDDKNNTSYFIQAGVFADVSEAELLAVDVVLAAPDEEVHVKPLKGTQMYRITIGPIVSSEHATKVSGLLTEAGLDNFKVSVKQKQTPNNDSSL